MKITANQVTITRILLLPIPAAMLIYGSGAVLWTGFFLAIALGATDAVDGYLARRDGPTILGGLLDPVADKIFVAAFLFPIVGRGHMPWWMAGLIFTRELLVTALRTSMAARQEKLVTSKLGKIKTIVQMGGLAIYVLLHHLDKPRVFYAHGIGLGALALFVLVYLVRGKRPPFWVATALILWGGVAALSYYLRSGLDVAYWVFMVMTVLTWVSGLDYLIGASRVFARQGLRFVDAVRGFWSLSQGLGLVAVVGAFPATALLALVPLACALCVGGIDNVVAAHSQKPIRAFVLLSAIVSALAAIFVYLAPRFGVAVTQSHAFIAIGAALTINAISLVRAYFENREVFSE